MNISIEALLTALGVMAVGIGAWVETRTKIKALEIKIERQEKLEDKNDRQFTEIMKILNELKESTSEKFSELHTLYREVLIEISQPKNK